MSGIGKIAVRRVHTGDFKVDQQQRLAQQAAVVTNSHRDMLLALVNRAYVAATTDTTLAGSAGVYTTLLTTTITTVLATGYLLVTMTASGTHPTGANATIYFKLYVDGVLKRGCYHTIGVANCAWSQSILVRVAVTRGAHTVRLDWSTDSNSARINASTATNEHAAMLVQEAA